MTAVFDLTHRASVIEQLDEQYIFSVSELSQQARGLLEEGFGTVLIEGEISNFVCPYSGHWYFTIKDDKAQVRCAMFKMHNRRVSCSPEDGMQVILQAKVSIYPDRGDFQLIAEQLHEVGSGALQQQFEALKKKLSAKGLFDEDLKQNIPDMPQTIGVITSPSGAAIRDILSVLDRRFPIAKVIIYPTLVQGEQAADGIVTALKLANKRKEAEVLIVARGGGSLEDLWPFNEENVALAIAESEIPIVSGVGHEVDFTIADFVADVRAPTPSVAAETVSPDIDEINATITGYASFLLQSLLNELAYKKESLGWMAKQLRMQHPEQQLLYQQQKLDYLTQQLQQQIQQQYQGYKEQLARISIKLHALSPLKTLARGYALITDGSSNKTIYSYKQVQPNDTVVARLGEGKLVCTVKETQAK